MKLVRAQATFEQPGFAVATAIDDGQKSAWAVDGAIGKNQAACFELETPVNNASGTTLTFIIKFENNDATQLGTLSRSRCQPPPSR